MQGISILKAVILGAIQGATEFLPISSSGHFVLAQHLLDVRLEGDALLALNICLHFGTLFAILVFFRHDIFSILKSVSTFKISKFASNRNDRFVEAALSPEQGRKLFWLLLIGTIPAATIGIGFKSFFEGLNNNPFMASIMLLVTGCILFGTHFIKHADKRIGEVGLPRAIIIGFAQAFAIFPGISRSGSTIAAALYLGLNKEFAARFSFLLAIPAIGGAGLLGLKDLRYFQSEDLLAILLGTLVSFLVGYACIKWLLNVIRKGRLAWFALYCWLVGGLGIYLTV